MEKLLQLPFGNDLSFIKRLNKAQTSWRAARYPELDKLTFGSVLKRSGYGNGKLVRYQFSILIYLQQLFSSLASHHIFLITVFIRMVHVRVETLAVDFHVAMKRKLFVNISLNKFHCYTLFKHLECLLVRT